MENCNSVVIKFLHRKKKKILCSTLQNYSRKTTKINYDNAYCTLTRYNYENLFSIPSSVFSLIYFKSDEANNKNQITIGEILH